MPQFSKRHYEAIATVLQRFPKDDIQGQKTVDAFADMLGRDNPAFNRERFIRATMPGANVRARTK